MRKWIDDPQHTRPLRMSPTLHNLSSCSWSLFTGRELWCPEAGPGQGKGGRINMILTTDRAHPCQPYLPGHAALPHCHTGLPPGSPAIKLVFYCQPRHNLPLIKNLPHRIEWKILDLTPCVGLASVLSPCLLSGVCVMNHCHVWRI